MSIPWPPAVPVSLFPLSVWSFVMLSAMPFVGWAAVPSSTPAPVPSVPLVIAPAVACVPGQAGIPDSPLGHLMCGDYLTNAHGIAGFARIWWPLLATVLVLFIGARV